MLNPWRLRLLESLERLGTVRAVADELLLSPSSVSQQLAVLETEAGAALFERRGRMLALTPTGELLVLRARDVLDRLEAIESELSEVANGERGHVRLGGFASSVSPLLAVAAATLAREHPGLTVELVEVEPREATPALQRGAIDVAVTVDELDGVLLSPQLAIAPLMSDPLLALLPTGHPLAHKPVVQLADLARERWALDHEGTYLGELVPRECRAAGFEPLVGGRFSSYGVLLGQVASGGLVGVLPGLAVEGAAGVEARPVSGLADRRIVAAVRTGSAARPATAAVIDALARAATPRPRA